MKKLLALMVVVAAALAVWFYLKPSNGPSVSFAKTTREKISNVLSTNGKVEPSDYIDVRVESAGLVKQVLVHAGDSVQRDQVLAELSQTGLQQELDAAIAREAQARANLQILQAGGRSAPTRRTRWRAEPFEVRPRRGAA